MCYGLDLLRWGDDLISVPADYNDELFDQELTRVSESDNACSRATSKDKYLLVLLPIRVIYVILRSFLPLYRFVLPIKTQ